MSGRPPLLAALMRRLRPAGRKAAPGPAEPDGRLFRDQPADWKDALYTPKGFRRRK